MSKDLEIVQPDICDTIRIKDGTRVYCLLDVSTTNEIQQESGTCTPLTDEIIIVVDDGDWYIEQHSEAFVDRIRLYSEDIKKIPIIGKMLYAVCFTQIVKLNEQKVKPKNPTVDRYRLNGCISY